MIQVVHLVPSLRVVRTVRADRSLRVSRGCRHVQAGRSLPALRVDSEVRAGRSDLRRKIIVDINS